MVGVLFFGDVGVLGPDPGKRRGIGDTRDAVLGPARQLEYKLVHILAARGTEPLVFVHDFLARSVADDHGERGGAQRAVLRLPLR